MTRRTVQACWVPVVVYAVLALVSSVMYVREIEMAWWFRLLREPLSAAVLAAWVIGLLIWQLHAPMGAVWKLAYRTGYNDARAEVASECPNGHDADGLVLPFIPPQRGRESLRQPAQN